MLRLDPDPTQVELMERLARQRGHADVLLERPADGGADDRSVRAALMVVLWRVLRVPGSRATILAPSAASSLASGELGHSAMGFLAEVCKTKDAALSSISTYKAWYSLEFGTEPGWEVRFCHNLPSSVSESAARSLTGLILDAGDSCTALAGCARELDAIARDPRGLVLRLW